MENAQTENSVACGQSRSTVMLEPARWRPEVVAFADAMEAKLRDNDEKGGWRDCAPHWLMMRMIGEAAELLEELDPGTRATAQFYAASRMLSAACEELDQFGPYLKTKGNPERVLSEAVDVANFAMMVSDVIAGSNAEGWGRRSAACERSLSNGGCDPMKVTMEEAVASGDGTLHGAIDHWQTEAARLADENKRLRYHLTELVKAADAAAMVIATIEAEDTTEEEKLQAVMDAIGTWAPDAIMGSNYSLRGASPLAGEASARSDSCASTQEET